MGPAAQAAAFCWRLGPVCLRSAGAEGCRGSGCAAGLPLGLQGLARVVGMLALGCSCCAAIGALEGALNRARMLSSADSDCVELVVSKLDRAPSCTKLIPHLNGAAAVAWPALLRVCRAAKAVTLLREAVWGAKGLCWGKWTAAACALGPAAWRRQTWLLVVQGCAVLLAVLLQGLQLLQLTLL